MSEQGISTDHTAAVDTLTCAPTSPLDLLLSDRFAEKTAETASQYLGVLADAGFSRDQVGVSAQDGILNCLSRLQPHLQQHDIQILQLDIPSVYGPQHLPLRVENDGIVAGIAYTLMQRPTLGQRNHTIETFAGIVVPVNGVTTLRDASSMLGSRGYTDSLIQSLQRAGLDLAKTVVAVEIDHETDSVESYITLVNSLRERYGYTGLKFELSVDLAHMVEAQRRLYRGDPPFDDLGAKALRLFDDLAATGQLSHVAMVEIDCMDTNGAPHAPFHSNVIQFERPLKLWHSARTSGTSPYTLQIVYEGFPGDDSIHTQRQDLVAFFSRLRGAMI